MTTKMPSDKGSMPSVAKDKVTRESLTPTEDGICRKESNTLVHRYWIRNLICKPTYGDRTEGVYKGLTPDTWGLGD